MEQQVQTNETNPVQSVPDAAIQAAIDNYKVQFEQTQQSLRNLDAEYAQRKTTGTDLLNQLHGAITALTLLVTKEPEAPKTAE